MNRRGQTGEAVVMIYRLLVVTAVAFVIFGVSSVFYDYDIDVRDAEAILLGRVIFDCLAPAGVLNLDDIPKEEFGRIVSYCGVSGADRVYVGIDVIDSSGKKIAKLYEGDSGSLWIKELYGQAVVTGKAIVGEGGLGKYNPGYIKSEYSVFILDGGKKSEGRVEMEVLVNYDK